jgi:hypothetical protein
MSFERKRLTAVISPLRYTVISILITCLGCNNTSPKPVRLRVVPIPIPKNAAAFDFKITAPAPTVATDPAICDASDPKANKMRGLASMAPYTWSGPTHVQNLYARLWIVEDTCTGPNETLSSQDQSRMDTFLKAIGVDKKKSFASSLSIVSNGVTYPDIVPFSYTIDKGNSLQTVQKTFLPWQVSSVFKVTFKFVASQSATVNTAQIFNNIVTQVAGAGGASTLLSPVATGYVNAANQVAQSVVSAVYDKDNTRTNDYTMNIAETEPGNPPPPGPDRAQTYRFTDNKGQPLAGIRISVSFTRTIAKVDDTVDPTTDAASQPPTFSDGIPDILSQQVGGPASGSQTLLQQLLKDSSYQALIKTDSNTSASDFKTQCLALESSLKTNYGLNKWDIDLALGEVLNNSTLYLSQAKFYSSGCFTQGRADLKRMGISGFDVAPH